VASFTPRCGFLNGGLETVEPLVNAFQVIENYGVNVNRVHADGTVGGHDFFDDGLNFTFRFHVKFPCSGE
jgi:hypothetical protein